jgi:hypothetical protein
MFTGRVRYGLLALLVPLIVFGFCRLSLRGDTFPIVLTGQLAPGTADGRFTALGQASVNSSGDIAFHADLDVGGVNGAGIFKVAAGILSPVALEGQTLPDSPDKSFGALFSDPQINNAGDIVFTANFAAGTSAPPPQGLFLYSGETLRKLLDTTTVASGAPGQTFASFRNVSINDAGTIAFAAELSVGAVGPAIYLMTGDTLQRAVSTPNVGLPFSLNNNGDIAFITPQYGIALFANGSIQTLALAGQTVSNSTLTVFTQGPLSVNDDREVAFLNYSPAGSGRGGTQPTPDGIVRYRSGLLEKIAAGGDSVPGFVGATFSSSGFLEPRINQSEIVFTGRTTANGETIDLIARHQNGLSTPVTRSDEVLEGLGMLNFIGEPNIDTRQGPLVTFVANLGPMVGIFAAQTDPRFTLLFPHVADGLGAGTGWRTTFVLANRSTSAASATLSFYDDNGAPMSVSIGGQRQSQYAISIPALGIARVQTEGTGPLKTGWAKADTDQSLSGIALFASSDGSGNFVAEAGADATVPLRSFSMFAEAEAGTSTGMALVNPNTVPADVTLILKDAGSNEIARSSITLPPMGHLAKYSREIFAGVSSTDGEGKIEVVSTRPLAALTLRQRGPIFTSLPVIP